MDSKNREKEKFWLAKLAEAKRHDGSYESFCHSRGLSPGTFAYWRKRLRERESKALVPQTKFIPVEISGGRRSTLPDPKWLAELIGHLVGGAR